LFGRHEQFRKRTGDSTTLYRIAPQIFVADIQAGGSNILSDDVICMTAMDNFEKEVQDVNTG